jgi:hypothetical protein
LTVRFFRLAILYKVGAIWRGAKTVQPSITPEIS